MDPHIQRLEELTINAFPAQKTELLDGWILRFTEGYTYRANCVCPIYKSHIDLQEKIKVCEKKYFAKGIPTVFKITSRTEPDIDAMLEQNNYFLVKTVNLMTRDISDFAVGMLDRIQMSDKLDNEWIDASVQLSKIQDKTLQNLHKSILQDIASDVVCVKAIRDNKIIGCGLGVLENGFIGLYDIHVDEKYRQRGIGLNICQAILKAGTEHLATEAYLQVHNANDKAIKMYQKLGFSILYTYWFREKKAKYCKQIAD